MTDRPSSDSEPRSVEHYLLSESDRDLLAETLDIGIRFAVPDGDSAVVEYRDPAEVRRSYAYGLPAEGVPLKEIVRDFDAIARFSVRQGHPSFLGFPDSANATAGLAADVLIPFLNQNLITVDRGAPVATFVERQVIRWFRKLAGFEVSPDVDSESIADLAGMVTPGGNLSNIISIAAALNRAYPGLRRQGARAFGDERPLMFVPADVEHFSYEAAAALLGIGEETIRYVDVGADYAMDVRALESSLAAMREDERAVAVVAYAGNTRTGSIDPISAIVDVARDYGAWVHADACHGVSHLFSPSLRRGLRGVDRCDSIAMDPHKALLVSYPLSVVIFRDGRDLARIGRLPESAARPGFNDLGASAPFLGSRSFESLKIWAVLRNLGSRKLGDLAEARHRLAHEWADLLKSTGKFRPLHVPHMYKVAFVLMPQWLDTAFHDLGLPVDVAAAAVDDANRRFAGILYRSGLAAVDVFLLRDVGNVLGLGDGRRVVLGSVTANPCLDGAALRAILDSWRGAISEVEGWLVERLRMPDRTSAGVSSSEAGPSPASWGGRP